MLCLRWAHSTLLEPHWELSIAKTQFLIHSVSLLSVTICKTYYKVYICTFLQHQFGTEEPHFQVYLVSDLYNQVIEISYFSAGIKYMHPHHPEGHYHKTVHSNGQETKAFLSLLHTVLYCFQLTNLTVVFSRGSFSCSNSTDSANTKWALTESLI